MGILINKSDFVGDYALVKSNSDDINLFIEKYEKEILMQLLGSDLLVLFQADLDDQVPQDQIYLDIYNPFIKEIGGWKVESAGMKDMCLNYVYFYYLRKLKIKASMSGPVVNENENSVQSSQMFLINAYNASIRTFKHIQYYIAYNKTEVYPTFAGVCKEYASIL